MEKIPRLKLSANLNLSPLVMTYKMQQEPEVSYAVFGKMSVRNLEIFLKTFKAGEVSNFKTTSGDSLPVKNVLYSLTTLGLPSAKSLKILGEQDKYNSNTVEGYITHGVSSVTFMLDPKDVKIKIRSPRETLCKSFIIFTVPREFINSLPYLLRWPNHAQGLTKTKKASIEVRLNYLMYWDYIDETETLVVNYVPLSWSTKR